MDWGIIILGVITGALIGAAINEYRTLPSHKTLPQEIAELAARDERKRIIRLLEARRDEFEKLEWWLETELVTDCIAIIGKKTNE